MRTTNSLKNILTTMGGRVLTMALSFVVRTVFIYTLTSAYLGVTGTLNSILSLLCLTELGIGAAINFSLYKPLAENDMETIRSIMRFSKKAFRWIAVAFLALSAIAVPFLPTLLNGGSEIVNLYYVYALYILSTCSSYCFFAAQTLLLGAAQKDYKSFGWTSVVSVLQAMLKIVLLLALRHKPAIAYYLYLLSDTVATIAKNYMVARITNKEFPGLWDGEAKPLEPTVRKGIFKNVVGLFTNNVCRLLNDGIDSVVVSSMMGVSVTGVFSNYLIIRQYVTQLINSVFGPMTSSIGNLCASESTARKEQFFETLQFVYFWLFGFCAISLWILIDPLIAGVWIRKDGWLIDKGAVFLLAFNFLIEGLAAGAVKYRDTNGLFWQTKFRYILSSVFNAGLSVYLVGPAGLGVKGALLGTTASLLILIAYDPVLVYREVFHKKPWRFYWMYFRELVMIFLTGGLVWLVTSPFSAYTVSNFLIKLAACAVIPNGLWYLLFRRDPRFAYLRDTALSLARKILRSRRRAAEA